MPRPRGPRPTPAFAAVALDTTIVPRGDTFGRIYHERFADPLGFGKTPSRFSDQARRIAPHRFGVLYLGSSLKVCFLEAVLRDERDGLVGDWPICDSELATRRYVEIQVTTDLTLIDLTEDYAVRMGIPSDVARGSDQTLARAWSQSFHGHPSRIDGVLDDLRVSLI